MTRRAIARTLLGVAGENVLGGFTDRWVVYYSNREPLQTFRPYSVLIFDSRYHPSLEPLTQQGKIVVGYVSLGEVSEDYTYFQDVRSEGLLLRPSPAWTGNHYVDIRDARWQTRLCDTI
ncbi:MAG: endo alpha-1,4 polygalactosaminidase, partial [Bryobacteraceae bacterium]